MFSRMSDSMFGTGRATQTSTLPVCTANNYTFQHLFISARFVVSSCLVITFSPCVRLISTDHSQRVSALYGALRESVCVTVASGYKLRRPAAHRGSYMCNYHVTPADPGHLVLAVCVSRAAPATVLLTTMPRRGQYSGVRHGHSAEH